MGQYDTKKFKNGPKNAKNAKICQLLNEKDEIDITLCANLTCLTPKVFKFIGTPNDGRRHGRGTYLFIRKLMQFSNLETMKTVSDAPCVVHWRNGDE
jgi:hypothetical protein